MTTKDPTVVKAPRTRKGVSDKTLYKYVEKAKERFNLTDTSTIGELKEAFKNAYWDDTL